VFAVFANHWITALIFSVLAALTIYEFHKNTNKLENVNVNPIIPAIASFMLLWIFAFALMYHINLPLAIYFVFYLYFFVFEIFRNKTNPINNIAYSVLGQLYIALPFLFLYLIQYKGETYLLALFVLIWANDSFAYLAGSTFGKHKMCERISPKKTWEGFAGGLMGTLVIAFVFWQLTVTFSCFAGTRLNITEWLIFAILVVIFGTLGDLLESVMKRTIGVKDSGTIMPGHGGFLDRFDSLLLAAPIVFIYLAFVT